MPDAGTAPSQLIRLLHIIPAAGRDGGASIRGLAEDLEVTEDRILDDVRTLTDRAYYHGPEGGSELQVMVEEDRLSIFSAGGFRRPIRLTAREALCVALGLRSGRGAAAPASRPGATGLLERLERDLALPGDPAPEALATDALAADPEGVRATLAEALRLRVPCRFGYLKEGAEAPEIRQVEPWALLHAEGCWYVAGRDPDAAGPRVFRVDRMLGAELREGRYEIPPGADAGAFLEGGRVFFRAPGEEAPRPARVRYSPGITRWVRERWPAGTEHDGGWIVEHPLADPGWVVRHVLQYGPDAELLEPVELRAVVARVAERMAAD